MRFWAAGLVLALNTGVGLACEGTPWSSTQMPETLTRIAADHGPIAAWYDAPTARYPHGALGDPVEGGVLEVLVRDDATCRTTRITLPEVEVFEDTAPRLVDLDGDGAAEIIVVQAHARLGARLVVYGLGPDGGSIDLRAATPNIGTRNRWLAPLGAADLDGDGAMEIAFVDRPHLARTLQVWRYQTADDGTATLTQIASRDGLTNHRFGDPTIPGGIRRCDGPPEMIITDSQWTRVLATTLTRDGDLRTRDIGSWSQGALTAALRCR
ncbi:MAG: VCBS repeat-containing protein [Pseudomonadota bacterium]